MFFVLVVQKPLQKKSRIVFSVCRTESLFWYTQICFSVCLSVCMSLRLSVCLSVSPSVCLSVSLSVSLSASRPVSLSVRKAYIFEHFPMADV